MPGRSRPLFNTTILTGEVVGDERLHLHAGEAAGEVDDRPVGLGSGGGDRLIEAHPHRGVGAGVEAATGLATFQLG